ncbi:multicopper oxidase domain-containing protein [Ktedonospora formicarum]|uniref:Plastocyanin-like domain-containing protein n=1 Tax=Ktedonospora formicarum TaxID=2778364 RepID=A0A8J3MVJ9_9CHLR|nr:multicopper oxidase domain-containing protein [Ktedonospora formicarum]GHO47743.1 hypothetical protein KSX_59060 [Ktedonospora formicarum]
MTTLTKREIGMLFLIALTLLGMIGIGIYSGFQRLASATQTQTTPPARVHRYTLYVRSAWLTMPDGKKIYTFGYTDDPKGPAKIPGPMITADEGDQVIITLKNNQDPTMGAGNAMGDGHTIHLHGLDVSSKYDGDPMTVGGSIKQGFDYTYQFTAKNAGTYWYHCHEGAPEHIQMGMYGPIVIYPRGTHSQVYAGTPRYDKEYTFLLSEMDSKMHQEDYDTIHNSMAMAPNWVQYQPDYFLINGKAWPDVMNDPRSYRSPKLTHIWTSHTQCSIPASMQRASFSLVLHLLHRRHFPQNLRYAVFIVPMLRDCWRHWHLDPARFHTPGKQRPDPTG